MDIWIEVLLCFIYIFQIIIIAVFVKPTCLILLLFGLYTFITTSMIYYYGKCKNFDNMKYVTITLYSIFCPFAYLMIYRIYHFYPRYRLILLILPVVYIVIIKSFECVFKCQHNSVIKFGIQLSLDIMKTIKKFVTFTL
jgi:hypothetical protein